MHLLAGARCSTVYETDPEGVGTPQGQFLNQVIVGETTGTARQLLEELLAIEKHAGRVRPFSGAPRTLDLDLILFDGLVIDEPDLTVPHPRFRERAFVLEPLAEVAPWFLDPVTGESMVALRDRLRRLR